VLVLTIFNYETPYYLKRKDRYEELYKLMGRIYTREQVQLRIDEIDVREVIGVEYQNLIYKPTY
jgi:hypothetical protein